MTKLTPKQEGFCISYIETGNASEAYRRSYNAEKMSEHVVHNKASDLLKKGEVRVRLEALQSAHQERHNVTIDSITAKYLKAEQFAYEQEQPAAVSAITALARLHGLITDKKDVLMTS